MALVEVGGGVAIDPIAETKGKLFAVLADDGTLLGFDPDGEVRSVEVPADTDLEVGKYTWDEAKQRFEPIPKAFPKPRPAGDPDSLIAVALGFRALAKAGAVLPAYTQEWLKTFERYPDDYAGPGA